VTLLPGGEQTGQRSPDRGDGPEGREGLLSYRVLVQLFGGVAVALSASEARKRLFPLIEQVNDDEEAVEIVSKSGTAFLVPEHLWRSLVETRYLLRSPANARRLLDSVARVEAGEFERRDLISDGDETGRQAS
jgi:antitoxin YefM